MVDTAALKNQGAAFARGGIWFAAGVTVGRGWLDGDTAITIVGTLLALGGSVWTGIANTNSSIVAAATAMPEVDSKKLAAAIADPTLKEVAAAPLKET